MAKGSAPPRVPTPICRINVVRAPISLTECQESPRDVFPQELSNLNGPNFLGVNVLLVRRDALFWDVSRDFLRFRQRANPLVIVAMLRGRVFFFLQEHQLRVEQEAALFWQVSCRPLDCENVELPKPASPLASSCKGDGGIQVFLPFTSRTRGTHWRQFDVRQRSDTCFASTLLPHRAPRQFVSPSTPGDSGRLGTLVGRVPMPELRGMRAVVQFLRQSAESRGRRLDRRDEKKSQGASCARVNHAHVQFTRCAVLELVNEVQNHQLLMQSPTMLTQQAKTQSAAAVSKQNSLTEGMSADTAAKDGNIASTRASNVEPNAEVEFLNTDTRGIQYVNTHAAQHGRQTLAPQVESKESTMRIRTK